MKKYTNEQKALKKAKRMRVFALLLRTLSFLLCVITFCVFMDLPESFRSFFLLIKGFALSYMCLKESISIDQRYGYYFCEHCGHTHAPTTEELETAEYVGFKKRLHCPHCQEQSFHKKTFQNVEVA